MKYSVKFKVTLWYTIILALALFAALASAFWASQYYSVDNMKRELLDEVGDFLEDLKKIEEQGIGTELSELYRSANLPDFYDDGVMLSFYDENGQFINGILPDDFPKQYPFKPDVMQELKQGEEFWLLYDCRYTDQQGNCWWVRGINSYSSITRMIHSLTMLLSLLMPILIGFTAFIGYRMLKKALQPIYTITDTVKEINHASDLSKRLPELSVKDEFSRLTATFNEMLERLEHSFNSEKQFTSDAAHELRTPLSVILAHCEYCLDELKPSEEITDEIKIIYQKAERISRLVSQLLLMARAENGTYRPELEEIDLAILAESVIEELSEKAAAKEIRLSLKNDLENSLIQGDMVLMTCLLMNLTDNAISYGKQGGFAEIHLKTSERRLCIQVTDNGKGISPEDIDKIWNRFYRSDKSRTSSEGFGLGLFMVRWIAALHGGTADVRSVPGEETVFTVLLPG